MSATEVIRFRVTVEEKEQLRKRSADHGVTMSEEIRDSLGFSEAAASPQERFRGILQRAREAQESSGLPRMSEEEVIAFVEAMRKERANEAVAVYA